MSNGRDVYGWSTKHSMPHTLPTYANANLYQDCSVGAQMEEDNGPPPTAESRASTSSRMSTSSARRLFKFALSKATPQNYEDVWGGLAAWVGSQLERGRAVKIPNFFKITFQTSDGTRALSSRSNSPRTRAIGEASTNTPVFILDDAFITENGVLFKAPVAPGASLATGIPIVDLQYSAVAQASGVDKDMCKVMIRQMCNQLGAAMARGTLVAIELQGTGVITAVNKAVSFMPSHAAQLSPRGPSRGSSFSPRSPRHLSTPRQVGLVGGVQQPREEIALSVTPALSSRRDAPPPIAEEPADDPTRLEMAPGQGNDSGAAATAMIYRQPTKPRRLRGEGIVASINEIGFKDDNGNVAYPKFLMPERGVYLSPRAKRNQAEHSAVTAYDRYQNTLYTGIGSTEKQLSEIDHRWKEAIRTDQLKLQLMKSKAGEVSDFLQRQIMDKQARNQAERIKRLTTPDVFARTGYPPINSPTRDLMAAEVKMMQKSAIKAALSDQMRLKKDLDNYSREKSANDELVKLKALATQLEAERQTQYSNEELTRQELKESWERHAALKSVERRLGQLESKC